MTNDDGVAWLESLAARYEETARALRDAAARVRESESLLAEASERQADAPQVVGISEAIRIVMRHAEGPLRPREIWWAIRQRRIAISTRSADPQRLVGSSLKMMAKSGQVRQDGSGWVLTI